MPSQKNAPTERETMTFSDKLFKLRTDKGLSQNELAKNAGLSQTAIYYLEKGKRQAKFETIIRIAEALDTDFFDLIDDNDANLNFIKINRDHHDLQIYGEIKKRNFKESIEIYKEIQEQIETQKHFLLYSFPDINVLVQSLENYYQLLNNEGRIKADAEMKHAIEQIARLTENPAYQKKADMPPMK